MKIVATYTRNTNYKGSAYRVFTTSYADELYINPDYIDLEVKEGYNYIIDVQPRCKNDKAFFSYKVVSIA